VVSPLSGGSSSLQYLGATAMKQIQLATSITQPCIKADGVEVPGAKRYAVDQAVSHLYGGSSSKHLDATAMKHSQLTTMVRLDDNSSSSQGKLPLTVVCGKRCKLHTVAPKGMQYSRLCTTCQI